VKVQGVSQSYWYNFFKWDESNGVFFNAKNNKVLEVKGGKDVEASNVNVEKRNGSPAQKWKLIYSSDLKIQKKGLNKEFGLEIERPFYFVSKMWMNRVVECHGATHLKLNTLNKANKGQQFYLDDKTQTISPVAWKGFAMTIVRNGLGNILKMDGINARWF